VGTSFSSVRFFFKEFAENLRRSPYVSVTHGLQVVMSLMILGFFIILMSSIASFLFSLRNMVEVYAYLDTDLTAEQYTEIDRQLKQLPGVKELEYKSREDALKEFSQAYHVSVEGILEYNPLPPTYIFRPVDVSKTEELAKRIEAIDGVWQVRYGRKEVSTLMKLLLGMQVVFALTMLLLLSATFSSVNNIVRMSIYGRRREIRIMQLVGATEWFIRWPFLIEGSFFGLVGATAAVLAIYLIREVVVKVLSSLKIFMPSFVDSGLLFFGLATGLLALGVIVGLVSSASAVNRFLRVEMRRIQEMRRIEAV
jgi:cell division transport system permease protein